MHGIDLKIFAFSNGKTGDTKPKPPLPTENTKRKMTFAAISKLMLNNFRFCFFEKFDCVFHLFYGIIKVFSIFQTNSIL